ncbi:pirin-like C-terminal cupin domain-containing protein [Robiginitalea sp. M366]|uniref:pirin family protein n=1 Tax=Robiginitalea aestuariiviva TaxID=3036903 RepID=UPI00240D3039|nr:pirin-like C-terminal cupin domain-containing protein [Robiginitalea aestuariiviva]MDG1572778.1 pirin-like C-terminal cupin domain-containing protein [Robiginitalea aestuariiviva]
MAIKTFPLGFPWDTPDPFLFCVHHLDKFPAGNTDLGPAASLAGRPLGNDFTLKDGWRMYHGQTVPGFPSHPHCGFETVTIVTRGFCDHADSLGAAARFGEGDVQWITTGAGLQHSEMFPLLNPDGPNTLELFQIWLNLPAKSKRVSPYFSMLWKDQVPIVDQDGARIRLVAGSLQGQNAPAPPPDSWASDAENHVVIALLELEAGGSFSLPEVPAGVARRVYLFEGGPVRVADTELQAGNGAIPEVGETEIQASESPARLLWLQGKPIAEPVAKYGPFVMNKPEEIQAAMDEFRTTRFGGWPWRHPDPVHEAGRGRFARFPDGTEVEKD